MIKKDNIKNWNFWEEDNHWENLCITVGNINAHNDLKKQFVIIL